MKIDSVITMEVKTREEELEELLAPDGELKAAIDKNEEVLPKLRMVPHLQQWALGTA